ncbi:hypothetical protein [Streptomyces sp. NPDC002537]
MTLTAAKWLSQVLLVPTKGWWLRGDPAHVLTGVLFDAVEIPAEVIHAQAGSGDRGAVERAFRKAAITSAVIAEPSHGWYYALVPPGTAREWRPPLECLGPSHSIAVPPPHRTGPPGIHWLLTPPDSAASLCDPEDVRRATEITGGHHVPPARVSGPGPR